MLVFLRKNARIHKIRGELHELFKKSLVWFAGATPDIGKLMSYNREAPTTLISHLARECPKSLGANPRFGLERDALCLPPLPSLYPPPSSPTPPLSISLRSLASSSLQLHPLNLPTPQPSCWSLKNLSLLASTTSNLHLRCEGAASVRVHVKGAVLRNKKKDVFLPSKHLLGALYKTLPSKNRVFTENPYRGLLRSEGYLNRSFLGVKERREKGDVKRGEMVGDEQGPKGKEGEK